MYEPPDDYIKTTRIPRIRFLTVIWDHLMSWQRKDSKQKRKFCISHSNNGKDGHRSLPTHLESLFKLTEEHSKWQTRFQSNALNAIDGLMNQVPTLYYGPTTYLDGLPSAAFDYALCWYEEEFDHSKRRAGFPSWSWAGWDQSIHFEMGK